MPELQISKSKFKRTIYLLLGFFFVGLAVIGAFIPIMPTTIFLILATWSFMRSSEKYYIWLTTNKYFGRMISNYNHFRGIEKKTRIKSLIVLWLTLIISMLLVKIWWVVLILIVVGIGVSWHLFALKTLTDEEIKRLNDEFNK